MTIHAIPVRIGKDKLDIRAIPFSRDIHLILPFQAGIRIQTRDQNIIAIGQIVCHPAIICGQNDTIFLNRFNRLEAAI